MVTESYMVDYTDAHAYHEAGHAVVGEVLGCPPLIEVSLYSHESGKGQWGYVTRQGWSPHEDLDIIAAEFFKAKAEGDEQKVKEADFKYAQKHSECEKLDQERTKKDICVRLAGFEAARKQCEDYPFWYAGNDVSETLDKLKSLLLSDNDGFLCSPEEVQSVLIEQTLRARQILDENGYAVEALAKALLENKTLPGEEAVRLIREAQNLPGG